MPEFYMEASMNNKIPSNKLQTSWNYRQINESYNKDKKFLLRLFIPIIIFFVLIFGNIYSNASNFENTKGNYNKTDRAEYDKFNKRIEEMFLDNDWYGISSVLDDIPEKYRFRDLRAFCKGVKGSFVQIGEKDPVIYFKDINSDSKIFMLSRLMLSKYGVN